jgi:hypothetical protein
VSPRDGQAPAYFSTLAALAVPILLIWLMIR